EATASGHAIRLDVFIKNLVIDFYRDFLPVDDDVVRVPLVVADGSTEKLDDVIQTSGFDRIAVRLIDLHLMADRRKALFEKLRVKIEPRVAAGSRQAVGLEFEVFELLVGKQVRALRRKNDLAVFDLPHRPFAGLPAGEVLAVEEADPPVGKWLFL